MKTTFFDKTLGNVQWILFFLKIAGLWEKKGLDFFLSGTNMFNGLAMLANHPQLYQCCGFCNHEKQ